MAVDERIHASPGAQQPQINLTNLTIHLFLSLGMCTGMRTFLFWIVHCLLHWLRNIGKCLSCGGNVWTSNKSLCLFVFQNYFPRQEVIMCGTRAWIKTRSLDTYFLQCYVVFLAWRTNYTAKCSLLIEQIMHKMISKTTFVGSLTFLAQ